VLTLAYTARLLSHALPTGAFAPNVTRLGR
jgi:hypothetical protein